MQPKTQANPMATFSVWINSFYDKLQGTPRSKKDLLKMFCSASASDANWFLDENGLLYYAPKNSLFLSTLCVPLLWEDTIIFEHDDLLQDSILDNDSPRSFMWKIPGSCDPEGEMHDCDLSKLLPILFAAAMNDHSTMSMAWWVLTAEDDEKIVEGFSNKYFGEWKTLWCKSAGDIYLWDKSASNKDDAICVHPKTNALLRDTITQLKDQQKDLRVLKPEEISKIADNSTCGSKNTAKTDQEDLFRCGYASDHPNANMQAANQYNLWYNEVFYYKLLLTRTADKLTNNQDTLKPLNLTKTQLSSSAWTIENSEEIQNLEREIIISQQAVVTMQKTLDNFRATFPLHIWLNAYYEDVILLRKWLVKAYTPIHQLYYKLRNIQKKE